MNNRNPIGSINPLLTSTNHNVYVSCMHDLLIHGFLKHLCKKPICVCYMFNPSSAMSPIRLNHLFCLVTMLQSVTGRFEVPVPCSCSVRSRSTSTRWARGRYCVLQGFMATKGEVWTNYHVSRQKK